MNNNNNIYLKLLLFIFWIEAIILWLSFKNVSIIVLWILNTIVIVFMFFNLNLDFLDNIKKIFKKISIKAPFEKKLNLNMFDNILEAIKLFYFKWWFVFSIIVLVLAILDTIIFHKFNLSLTYSFLFFFIWLISLYQNILNWEIFLWNRIIWQKDVVFILSLMIVIISFILLEHFSLYEKLFYSLVYWFAFYIIVIVSFNYTNTNFKFFKTAPLLIYIFLTLLSFFVFIFNKIPSIKNYFTIEKIVYKERPIYKEKIVYKNKDSKIHIAPNWKMYEIFLTSTWAYFIGYNNNKKYFESYEKAVKIIDKFNQKDNWNTTGSNSNSITNNNVDITTVMSSLINNEENQIESNNTNETQENKNRILSYYNIIPEIIEKYWLNSDNKKDIDLKYITKNDKNYKYFKTAYYHRMFGRNFNVNFKLRCQNLAVLIGLAEWWKLQYNRQNLFDTFYKEAIKKWYKFDICCKSKYDYINSEKKACILK